MERHWNNGGQNPTINKMKKNLIGMYFSNVYTIKYKSEVKKYNFY